MMLPISASHFSVDQISSNMRFMNFARLLTQDGPSTSLSSRGTIQSIRRYCSDLLNTLASESEREERR